MTNALFAELVVAAFLLCYAVFSSIELGAGLTVGFFKDPEAPYHYLGPVWETTKVFLVAGVTAIFTFFPAVVSVIGSKLALPLLAAVLLMGIQVATVVVASRNPIMRWLGTGAGLGAAFALVTCLLIFLTGAHAWQPLLMLYGLVLATSLAVAAAFFRYRDPKGMSVDADKLGFRAATALVILGTGFLVFLNVRLPGILVIPYLLYVIFLYAKRLRGTFWSSVLLVGTLFALTAQYPYLSYPHTAAEELTNAASFHILVGGLAVGLALVVPALILLYRLFASPSKPQ